MKVRLVDGRHHGFASQIWQGVDQLRVRRHDLHGLIKAQAFHELDFMQHRLAVDHQLQELQTRQAGIKAIFARLDLRGIA